VGTAFKISHHSFTKLNISKGFRAPNIAEISSNGKHEGTLRYEIGNNNLKPESSLQTDFIFGINTKHVTAELSIFDNYINHFIYLQKLNSVSGKDSIMEDVSTFKFAQTKANLYGGEISVDIHPHPFDWLHFENSFSYVRAKQINQPDSLSNLPFIPAPRLQSEIKLEKRKLSNHLVNAYFKFELEYNFKQNKILSAFNTETKTNDYTLLNSSKGADYKQKGNTIFSIYLSVNNLANTAYQNHLSRLKYAPINYATGRNGIYNMGRNMSLKIVVPINIKSNKTENEIMIINKQ